MAKQQSKPLKQTVQARVVSITMPIAETDARAYHANHLDVRLNRRQSQALKAVFIGMHSAQEQMASGRFVSRPPDVIRLLLDRIADEIGVA